ncbi:MAG: DUF1254 domain-containing protein [Methanoregula sp.]|nr:DUF1254 domain-containing protein [Methanoregula sp.]
MRTANVCALLAALVLFGLVLCTGCSTTGGETTPATNPAPHASAAKTPVLTEEQAEEIGENVYVYAYPLVTMEMSRRILTNVEVPNASGSAPMNQFANKQELPDPGYKAVVRLNEDTLYSTAWLDLSREPIVLSVPDTGGRYYLMPVFSGWTDVIASPGKRTTGTGAGNFAITGPGWNGTLPANVSEIKSPTNLVWILGRTQTNGSADYDAVHAIQAQYTLTPLSSFGKPYTPPKGTVDPSVDMETATIDQVNGMNASAYFSLFATLLVTNPPAAADAPMVEEMAKIGIVPGQDFNMSNLDPAVAAGLTSVPRAGQERIFANISKLGTMTPSGWDISYDLGEYKTRYDIRAATAYAGLGANIAEDAVYPSVTVDRNGNRLNGTHNYVLHFNKTDLGVANAFWSVTMYDREGFFVPNPINRYAISSWMPLDYNADGSLDLYIQATSPGADKESNWLPAPDGTFAPTMRIYWPKEQVLNGTWVPPAIVMTR